MAQLALERALGMLAGDDAEGGAVAGRRHQLARLVGAHAPVAHELPLQPLADRRDQQVDQLVGQRRAPDQALLHAAVVLIVIGYAPQRLDRDPRPAVADQPTHHLGLAGLGEDLGQAFREMLAPGDRERVLHGVGADDLAEFLVPQHGTLLEHGPGDLDVVARQPARDPGRQVGAPGQRLGQRQADLLLEVLDQQRQHRIGERAGLPVEQAVVLSAELGGQLDPGLGRGILLQCLDVGEREPRLGRGVRQGAAHQLGAPPSDHRNRGAGVRRRLAGWRTHVDLSLGNPSADPADMGPGARVIVADARLRFG